MITSILAMLATLLTMAAAAYKEYLKNQPEKKRKQQDVATIEAEDADASMARVDGASPSGL